MDCLTTVIGTVYYGTHELNPILSILVSSNLLAFVIVKLTVTVAAGLLFILAEKILVKSPNKSSSSHKFAHQLLKIAYFGVISFFAIVVGEQPPGSTQQHKMKNFCL